jgi:hypothetical protein
MNSWKTILLVSALITTAFSFLLVGEGVVLARFLALVFLIMLGLTFKLRPTR